ncbi:MAG: metal-dependent transcriptional regulator [Clostridia bacterium]|nr:metal-dependent transcriptional regulator [Clostridia bacterium]
MKELTKSNEDYLEAVYILELSGEKIKSVKIANMLAVSRPAVNRAMNELFDAGLVEKTDYSEISLTNEGRKKAKTVYHKHTLVKEFLIKLGVSEKTAEIDCCKIEHIISQETIEKIEIFTKFK